MEGERTFDNPITLPKDISVDFYNKFQKFIDEDLHNVQNYFKELLTFKRSLFSIEIGAPIKILNDIEIFLRQHGYIVYNQIDIVHRDENDDFIDQNLFNEYPNEQIGATMIYVSYRNEFIHIAKILENIPFSCIEHEDCEPYHTLKGLLHGYSIPNIINFIDKR
jgi:hypothetical protein